MFSAINYARMARLRPVTGYPGTWDWTEGVNNPQDDGLFVVDVKTGARKLIVSFRQMRDALIKKYPYIDDRALFLNHTLWNREGDRIFFFVRADFNDPKRRVNVPMTVKPDGTELVEQRIFIGGHPESGFPVANARPRRGQARPVRRPEAGNRRDDRRSRDVPRPRGDTALSRDGKWIVNGATTGATMHYTILRRTDKVFIKTENFNRTGYEGGDLRIDPAPTWNRSGDRFAFPRAAKDGTRQMFEVHVIEKK